MRARVPPPSASRGAQFRLGAILASSNGSVVYDAVGDSPDWQFSLGFEAYSTLAMGEYVSVERPGVLSQMEIGVSSWACESGNWNDGTCATTGGATYPIEMTVTLYAVDYTSSTPQIGAAFGTVVQTVDVPFRPSADPDACPAGPTRFYSDVFGYCVNGLNTTVLVDFAGSDIVVPSEFFYTLEYNTEHWGPAPTGTAGPANSFNIALAEGTDVTVGADLAENEIIWQNQYPGYEAGLELTGWDASTWAVAFTVTNEGHVTGGGWFNSPEGALYGSASYTWFQGFEGDTEGWTSGGGYGLMTLVASGTAAIPPSSGDFHAVAEGTPNGPYSFFGGAHDYFPAGGWTAEVDVYLDPAWTASTGFDYSVASYNTSGGHLQDFIFHVTKDASTGKLLVAGSNNTNFTVREDLENINSYQVTTAGWYTLQHVFRDDNGVLAVDLNLLDSGGGVLFTETRSTAANTIPDVVGGNGYGWFTFISVPDGIAIDNTKLTGFGSALVGTDVTGRASFGFSARYKKGANVPSGNTNFVFQDGGLNFSSSSYEWLVVNQNDSNAQFKGVGTLAGMPGEYGFMLWAGDHDTGDTFRIKIWQAGDEDALVYDNGGSPLEGGNIVIHADKGKK